MLTLSPSTLPFGFDSRCAPLTAAVLAFSLSACSSEPAPRNDAGVATVAPAADATDAPVPALPPATTPPPAGTPTPPVPAGEADATQGGDGSALVLSPLRPEDAADLTGELGCSFALDRRGTPILIGKADVGDAARGQAVIRNGDVAEQLVTRSAGGFGAMERTPAYGGRDMTITIDPGERVSGGEAPTLRATLLAQRADGAERSFDGFWTCGP